MANVITSIFQCAALGLIAVIANKMNRPELPPPETDTEPVVSKMVRLFDPSDPDHDDWFTDLSRAIGHMNEILADNPMEVELTSYADIVFMHGLLASKHAQFFTTQWEDDDEDEEA